MTTTIDFLDNGLTPEQQEVMDDAYEALMSEVKVIDLKLYERLKANELTLADVYKLRNSKNVDIKIDEKEQYNLF
tara:strand:+ start:9314 stop:9538 length:225 start_codon:yes stop_codon:yes gene_type:complete